MSKSVNEWIHSKIKWDAHAILVIDFSYFCLLEKVISYLLEVEKLEISFKLILKAGCSHFPYFMLIVSLANVYSGLNKI